jgi:L-cysteine desulfidase
MDRIIAASPARTMQNTGILSAQHMNETDRTIFEIMLEKTILRLAETDRILKVLS